MVNAVLGIYREKKMSPLLNEVKVGGYRLAKKELFAPDILRMLGDKTNVSKKFGVNCSFLACEQ